MKPGRIPRPAEERRKRPEYPLLPFCGGKSLFSIRQEEATRNGPSPRTAWVRHRIFRTFTGHAPRNIHAGRAARIGLLQAWLPGAHPHFSGRSGRIPEGGRDTPHERGSGCACGLPSPADMHGKGPSAQGQRPSAAETEPPAASAGGKKDDMHRKTDMSAWSTRKTARLRAMRTQKKKKLGHRGRPCPRTLHNRTGWQRHAYLFMTSRRPSPQSGLRTREWRGLSRARHERNFSRQAGTCRRMQRQIKSKFEFELLSLFCQSKKCLFCFHSTFFPGQTPCPP